MRWEKWAEGRRYLEVQGNREGKPNLKVFLRKSLLTLFWAKESAILNQLIRSSCPFNKHFSSIRFYPSPAMFLPHSSQL